MSNNNRELILQFYSDDKIDFVMDNAMNLPKINIQEKLKNISSITDLKNEVLSFNDCELKKYSTNTVFSDGNPDSSIMLIGEAPGEKEDLQGIPFCGRSGKLLDQMLESIGLNREKVYITNTVFWRPPGNRKPSTEEIELCKPFLDHLVRLFNPKIIILVGATAASTILQTNIGISKLRGHFYQYINPYLVSPIDITVIFHPAYLLRQPGQKKLAWEDLKSIRRYLDEKNI
jgi:DNA polymerase